MNKEQLEEALKVVKEPITVNSIEYKYFDLDNYNKLVNVIEYCQYLQANVKPYVEAQDREIDQLTNNWNELEEWLKEYVKKNDNWYNNELSIHDKQYYGDSYYTTNYMLKKFLDKMEEIKEGNNVSSRD